MYEPNQNPQPAKQPKTGGIKVVCFLLAVALAGSFFWSYRQINALKEQLAAASPASEAADSISYENDLDSLKKRVSDLADVVASTSSKVSSLAYSPEETGIPVAYSSSLVDIASAVKKSIVLIRVTIPPRKVSSGFFVWTTDPTVVEGSGIVYSSDGYIITNEHVIDYAKTYEEAKIDVIMDDGSEYTASLVGSDSVNDLAVIKIEAVGLIALPIGDSSALRVGESVLAVGNPLGSDFAGSVTMGIVSALDRQISEENTSATMIQHDAAISPGNSGGALVNAAGQLVGINTLKIADTEVEGLGFAIPVNFARPIVDQLIEFGYVRGRITLGFKGSTFSERYANYYNMPIGLMVTEVTPDSGADLAGLQVYDIITVFDGESIQTMEDIEKVKSSHKVGDIVELTYYRNGKYENAKIIFMEDKSK